MSENIFPGDPVDIVNWLRIDGRLTTSGQPVEAQLVTISALGAAHVVNLGLHSHEKALSDERASVEQLGMEYVHIPVDFNAPTEEDYALFRSVMLRLHAATVHVHCIANFRVSAFLYRYRRDELAVGERQAHRDLEYLWRPGGVWARFIGHGHAEHLPHRYAGHDYRPEI